jgi:hypothetical protein
LRIFSGVSWATFLDLNTAFRRGHEHDAPRGAVHDGAEVQFVGDIRAGLDENLRHGLAVRIGLVGHEPSYPANVREVLDLLLA